MNQDDLREAHQGQWNTKPPTHPALATVGKTQVVVPSVLWVGDVYSDLVVYCFQINSTFGTKVFAFNTVAEALAERDTLLNKIPAFWDWMRGEDLKDASTLIG